MLISLVVLTTMLSSHESGVARYRIVQVPLPESGDIQVRDLNNRGQFTGNFGDSKGMVRGFLVVEGKLIIIPSLPECTRMFAMAINDSGVVVGYGEYRRSPGEAVAYRYQNGVTRALGPSGPVSTYAHDVNNTGLIVGYVGITVGKATVWDQGVPRQLPTSNGSSFAYAVNDKGVVLGATESLAAIWESGAVTELPGIPVASAKDINQEGVVVGRTRSGGAFIRRPTGTIVSLPTLTGFSNSCAYGVNVKGDAVGDSTDPRAKKSTAVLWRNGKVYDLNALLEDNGSWRLEKAFSINDRGQILGSGRFKGKSTPFLIKPVVRGRLTSG